MICPSDERRSPDSHLAITAEHNPVISVMLAVTLATETTPRVGNRLAAALGNVDRRVSDEVVALDGPAH
jgi:hypothetical protein